MDELTAHDAWIIIFHARMRLMKDNKDGRHSIEAFRILWAAQDVLTNSNLTIDLNKIFSEKTDGLSNDFAGSSTDGSPSHSRQPLRSKI